MTTFRSRVHYINKKVYDLYDKPKEGDVYIIVNKAWDGWDIFKPNKQK